MSRLAKKQKQVQDLPFTLEETKQVIDKLNQDLFDICTQINQASQNQDRQLILQLINDAKKLNTDINNHEAYLNKLENNPNEYQLLMW